MELYLIRHGQSLNNSVGDEKRVEDPPLTEVGQQQAQRLAQWIVRLRLTRLITSPFLRTLQTTEPVRQIIDLAPSIWVELHEQGGCMAGTSPQVMQGRPGMTREEIADEFPGYEIPPEIDGAGWWKSQPYESVESASQRACRLVARVQRELASTDHRVAMIAHNRLIQLVLENCLTDTAPLDELYNTSVTKLNVTPQAVRLVYLNQVEHLPDQLVTPRQPEQ